MTEALETHLQRQIEHSGQFFWHRLRWRVTRSYLPKDSPFALVDVGAGAGLLANYLAKDRPQASYRFVEPIESLRTILTQLHGEEADLLDAPDFGTAQFVTLLDVLEHQEDDRAFMQDLVGKMADGSTLLLTVPALQRLWSPWDVALGHFRRYDKGTLGDAIADLPLKIQEMSFLFPEMVPLGRLRARKADAKVIDADDMDAEFPDLPGPVNDVLYGLGTASLALRRHWHRGTSLFLAATVSR
jgi:hypothetical protein